MGMIGNSLAQGLISGANIQDGTVDTPDIKDSAVTAAKIASGVVTPTKMDFSAGTANGVAYLNGSKVLTTGSALVFDGTNLGVGVSPSAWSQGKSQEIGYLGNSVWSPGGNEIIVSQGAYYNGGWKYSGSSAGAVSYYSQITGIHRWNTAPSGTAGNAISFTQAMTLDASGRLVVNGTSPNSTTVLTLQESASLSSALAMKNRNSTQTWAFAIDTLAVDDKALGFLDVTNNVMRMTLDTSGKLLVGLTSGTGFVSNLVVNRQGVTNSPIFSWTNATSNSGHCHVLSGGGAGITADGFLAFGSGENGGGTFTERARIDTSGNLTVNGYHVMRFRGGMNWADVNSFTGSAYDGYWQIAFSGHSGWLFSQNSGGSAGTIQMYSTYFDGPWYRSKTDNSSWTSWRQL